MGMRVVGTAQSAAASGAGATGWQQRQQSIKDLMSALQAGDLGDARKAFGSLPAAGRLAGSDGNSPLAPLGKALQSGDLAAAQQAAQAWQAARSGHHHRHGTPADSSATGTPLPAPAGAGTVVDLAA